MEAQDRNAIFNMADKFIQLANELARERGSMGEVSTAIRYAAARYNAFEVSKTSQDMPLVREEATEWFTEQYKLMFLDNMDRLIDEQTAENTPQ
jgi:hypothetical protein